MRSWVVVFAEAEPYSIGLGQSCLGWPDSIVLSWVLVWAETSVWLQGDRHVHRSQYYRPELRWTRPSRHA